MTSTYGESVKFYDRMSVLHGQLKSCEEEQHVLQEEFGKLWNQSSPRLSEFQVDKQVTFSQNQLYQNGNNLNEEERRRQRNKMLLDKIKELEGNASVFAARSEKLKVLRSEYDAIAKKFLANRGRYISPSTLQYSPPVMNGSIKSSDNFALKSKVVDTGVNTEITGEVIPADSTQSINSATASLHYRAYGVTERIQQNGQETSPVYKTGFQVDMEVEKLLSAASQRVNQQQNSVPPVYPMPIQSVRSERHLQTFHETQHTGRLANTVSMEKDDTINNIDMEEKIKHNSYFDLSTTSDSELTSSRNPPRRNVVPVNIIMDDTTQSDTFSMPLQIPLGNREVPDQLLKMNLTSESESLVDRFHENGQKDGQKHLKRKNHTKFTMNEGQDTIPKHASKPTDKNEGQEEEASEASVSFTTSMGDSVMDSIQNKTLDESSRLDAKPESRRGSIEDLLEVNSSPPRMVKTLEEPEIPTKDKDSKDFDVFKVQNESTVTSAPSVVVPSTPAQDSYLDMKQPELGHSTPAPNMTPGNDVNRANSSIPSPVKDDEDDKNNQTFDLETQWNVETDQKAEPHMEKGMSEKPEGSKEASDTVIPVENAAATSARPKTAAAAKTNSAASRRMRIKLDYDSDSEPSEPVQPAKSATAFTAATANQQSTNPVEDDDFDDFFDI